MSVPVSAEPTWCADLLDGAGDGAHRHDDAEHGGHDADAGERVGDLLENADRLGLVLVVHVDLAVHQPLEIVRRHAAHQYQSQGVAQELDRVVLVKDRGILLEERAVLGLLDVRLDRDQSVLAGGLEELVQQAQRLEVELLAERGGCEQGAHLGDPCSSGPAPASRPARCRAPCRGSRRFPRAAAAQPDCRRPSVNPPSTDPMTTTRPTMVIILDLRRARRSARSAAVEWPSRVSVRVPRS